MDYSNKMISYVLTLALVFSFVTASVPQAGEASPQVAFVEAFVDGLESRLEQFDIFEPLENPLSYYILEEMLALAPYIYELDEALYELVGFHPASQGFNPRNMLNLLRFLPGFDEVEELLTTDVVVDILSTPGVDFAAAMLFEILLPEVEPLALFLLVNIASLFGRPAIVHDALGAELPTIELFNALEYLAGEGFVSELLEMEANERFAHIGTAFSILLADLLIEAIEMLEMMEELFYFMDSPLLAA